LKTYCILDKQENCSTKKHVEKMPCPYLSNSSKNVCTKMLEANMNADLTDFDLKHFCDGDPIYCYYYRSAITQDTAKDPTIEQETTPPPQPAEIPQKTWIINKEPQFKNGQNP
jgi:hypothetical protein